MLLFRPETQPVSVNQVIVSGLTAPIQAPLQFETNNSGKLEETAEILGLSLESIRGRGLDVKEIQSRDPREVVSEKAIAAYLKKGCNPVIVEDSSLEIPALSHILSPPHIKDWVDSPKAREDVCQLLDLLDQKRGNPDRRAVARVIYAVYDGVGVHIREGSVKGEIADHSRGANGFGYDDIFIPFEQPEGQTKTQAEMTNDEKNKYSPRRKALDVMRNNPFKLGRSVLMIAEPYPNETERLRVEELSTEGLQFGYMVESFGEVYNPQKGLVPPGYKPVVEEEHGSFYIRYTTDPESASLGLVLTNIELDRIKRNQNGTPVLWQMGPERRRLAIALRALYYDINQSPEIWNIIDKIDNGEIVIPERSNRRFAAIEGALGLSESKISRLEKNVKQALTRLFLDPVAELGRIATRTPAFADIGYRKLSATQQLSRRKIAKDGLLNRIGKYARRVIELGPMPPVTGQRDVLVMSAIGHMLAFAPRNSVFAVDIDRQIKLINQAKGVINNLPISDENKPKVLRNIGASLGCEDVDQEIANARKLYNEAGVRAFRIYTINADPRVVALARRLRQEFGDEIEIFVGQIADKKQALELIAHDIRVDALVLGHGGGRQCTSAVNGMAITTIEDLYKLTTDERFNHTTILVEGGVGRSVGIPLIMGADGVTYYQQLVHGTIEAGDLWVEDKRGRKCQPYPGDASTTTQLIEAFFEKLRIRRTDPAGRTYTTEGSPGFMYNEAKAPSMAFWVNQFLVFAARTLADLGVKNMAELRTLLAKPEMDILRFLTNESQTLQEAYRDS